MRSMRILFVAAWVSAGVMPLEARVDFVREVKPILENHCVRCHGPNGAMRGIRLDKRERAWMIVEKKKPEDSVLYMVSKAGIMPPGKDKVTSAELEVLRKWIAEGARWPKGLQLIGKNPFLSPSAPERLQ